MSVLCLQLVNTWLGQKEVMHWKCYLKSNLQVGDPSESTCRKMMKHTKILYFHKNIHMYTNVWQIKGKTNIKCLSKVLGHHVPLEQLQRTLALILQVSELSGGMNTILPKDIPSFGILMMVVESTVSHVGPNLPWVFIWVEIWWLRRP